MDAATTILNRIVDVILNPIVFVLFLVAFLYFLWGIFIMILRADDSSARSDGRSHMFWGIVGMFIMVSVYGILKIVLSTFGIPNPPGFN